MFSELTVEKGGGHLKTFCTSNKTSKTKIGHIKPIPGITSWPVTREPTIQVKQACASLVNAGNNI